MNNSREIEGRDVGTKEEKSEKREEWRTGEEEATEIQWKGEN